MPCGDASQTATNVSASPTSERAVANRDRACTVREVIQRARAVDHDERRLARQAVDDPHDLARPDLVPRTRVRQTGHDVQVRRALALDRRVERAETVLDRVDCGAQVRLDRRGAAGARSRARRRRRRRAPWDGRRRARGRVGSRSRCDRHPAAPPTATSRPCRGAFATARKAGRSDRAADDLDDRAHECFGFPHPTRSSRRRPTRAGVRGSTPPRGRARRARSVRAHGHRPRTRG